MPPLHRVALISSVMFGGTTTFVCNLAGELVRRNVPVLVVSPERENDFATDFQKAGVRVILHDQNRMIYEDRMQAMLQALASFRPTVVIACLGQMSYEVLRHVPPGVHRMAVVQSDHPMFYDALSPYAGCLDAVVGISTKIAERLAAMEVFRGISKLCLLHGVNIPPTVVSRSGGGGQSLRVLYLGRLVNGAKRVLVFPEILAALQKSGIPFQWTIAGDGDRRAELERLMSSDDPEQKVVFAGFISYAEVPELLDKHDVFLLVSDAEGLPLSLLEAMGHGLVPVISDLESGIRDVVDATNGCLVPVDDVAGYAQAIIHLHEHRDELATKSAAARLRVQKEFSVAAMTDRWLAAFPAPPTSPPVWPQQWKISVPLLAKNPIYFFPPVRALRRLVAKLRS